MQYGYDVLLEELAVSQASAKSSACGGAIWRCQEGVECVKERRVSGVACFSEHSGDISASD